MIYNKWKANEKQQTYGAFALHLLLLKCTPRINKTLFHSYALAGFIKEHLLCPAAGRRLHIKGIQLVRQNVDRGWKRVPFQ